MNGIIGMTAIALQKGQSQERVLDCLQKIQSCSDYLLGLINDIRSSLGMPTPVSRTVKRTRASWPEGAPASSTVSVMSKIESGKMKLEPVNFDMGELLGTIRELIAPFFVNFREKFRISHALSSPSLPIKSTGSTQIPLLAFQKALALCQTVPFHPDFHTGTDDQLPAVALPVCATVHCPMSLAITSLPWTS